MKPPNKKLNLKTTKQKPNFIYLGRVCLLFFGLVVTLKVVLKLFNAAIFGHFHCESLYHGIRKKTTDFDLLVSKSRNINVFVNIQ